MKNSEKYGLKNRDGPVCHILRCQWGRFFLTHLEILMRTELFYGKGDNMINIDADAIFSVKSFIIYLIAINIITFLVMGLDKWKAKHGSWRIQEATLFTLVLFGGGIGGILGMIVFHHKTKKAKFQIGFPTILLTEAALIIYGFVVNSRM